MTGPFEGDRRLILRCISGDREASEVFIRQFSGLVYASVHKILISKQVPYTQQDIEDLHNTIFLKLFDKKCKKLRQYQGKHGCSVASWIRIVSIRIVLNHLRKKGMDSMLWQQKRLPLDEMSETRGDHMAAWALVERKEQARILEDGIRKLPARDRLFMKLHYDKGLSIENVSKAMDLSIQNGYTIKHRAIQRLKKYVKSFIDSEA